MFARAISLLFTCQLIFGQLATLPLKGFWNTDGPIYSLSEWNGILYAGGSFGYVGPDTGSAVSITADSSAPNPAFPTFNGPVSAMTPDGSGGWFFAGSFTTVGGFQRTNLVHILSDLSVAPVQYPPVQGAISSLAVVGSQLILGGSFTFNTPAGPRYYLAAVESLTGVPNTWNPNPFDIVSAITVYKTNIYIASGNGIAATSLDSQGSRYLSPRFGHTALPNAIFSFFLKGNILYIGGQFREINDVPHGCAAAMNLDTEAVSDWNPLPNSFSPFIYAISAANESVFLGGSSFVNAYASTDGALQWEAAVSGSQVSALVVQNDRLYVAGEFQSINQIPRRRLAALNPTNGIVLPFTAHANSTINALSIDASRIIAGGQFSSFGGQIRSNLVAFDFSTGAATAWAPATDGPVTALDANANAIFVGGQFTAMNSSNLYCLAALDTATGTNLAFDAKLGHSKFPSRLPLYTLARSGDSIFIGGSFTSVFGLNQKYAASFNATNFTVNTNWAPVLDASSLDGGVTMLLPAGDLIYAAGFFTKVSGQARTNIAALSSRTGTPAAWNPKLSGFGSNEPIVRGMSILGSTMYLWGPFTKIGTVARSEAGAVDRATGLPLNWTIPIAQPGRCFLIQPFENNLFTSIVPGSGAGVFETYDPITAAKTGWKAQYGYGVTRALQTHHAIFAASNGGLAVFEAAPSFTNKNSSLPGSLAFESFPGRQFKIDASTNLIDWSTILTADSSTQSFIDPDSGSFSDRFYRIVPSPVSP